MNLYLNLLNDAWTIYLTFSGILISIITLLYSFIMGKRSELEFYAEQIKLGNTDPLLSKRQKFTIKVIKKMVYVNKWIFCILCISVFNCSLSWVAIRFIPQEFIKGPLYVVMVLSLFIIVLSACQGYNLYKQYLQDTKI